MATAMPANAVKFSASGQINNVLSDIDNGDESALGFFGSSFSGTRIRFKGSEELDNGITIGGYNEFQLGGNLLVNAEFQGNGDFGESNNTRANERHADIYASGGFGKVSFGQGNGAANGTSEVDLSGTWRADYVHGQQCALGSITFGNTDITVGTPNGSIDGESRNDRIRYDTPTLGEVFSVAGSFGNGGTTEIGAWLDMTFGSTQLSVALGTTDSDDRRSVALTSPPAGSLSNTRETTMVSASLLLGNGLNFTVASTEQELDNDGDDNEQSYFKVGYKTGKHAFSYSVSEGDGGVQLTTGTLSNIESEGSAFAYNYQAASSLNLYAGLYSVEVDDDANFAAQANFTVAGGGADDVDSIMLGAHLTWSTN
jgi:hypothetical protein